MNSSQPSFQEVTLISWRLSFASGWFVALAWLLMGYTAFGHGGYHDVVSGLQAKLKKQPNDAALHYKLAEAHVGHDEWKDCLEEIKLVERLAPGAYQTGYLRGLALHIAGKDQDAKEALDDFLSKKSDHIEALATRGRVLVKLGSPLAAVTDFQKAMRLSAAPNSDLIIYLAHALRDSGKTQEASLALDAGLKTVGDKPSLLLCALEIETAAGDWDRALSRINALSETAPNSERWMATRAEILTKAGRADEARVAWAALRDRLLSLPNLERGTPQNVQLLQQSRQALGETAPAPVIAPPASTKL